MGYVIFMFVAAIIIYFYQQNKRKDAINNIERTNRSENLFKSFDYINYLGGHPLVETSKVKEGTLYIFSEKITFGDTNNNAELFSISIKDINHCSIETKESLTATRILLTGIFAWAIKKNKAYIRIDFKNKLHDSNNVLFSSISNNNDIASNIVKTINETRLKQIS